MTTRLLVSMLLVQATTAAGVRDASDTTAKTSTAKRTVRQEITPNSVRNGTFPESVGPLTPDPRNIKPPTSNTQPPLTFEADAHWMFDVGCWRLEVFICGHGTYGNDSIRF